jgi:hypothetical protein
MVHSSTRDVDRGVEFVGIKYVDTMDGFLEVNPQIFINQLYFQHVHSNIPRIIRPTAQLKDLIDKHRHLVDGVTCGVHIRRGGYQKDSRLLVESRIDENGELVPTGPDGYFASDDALEKFKKIIDDTPGNVFLASDSLEVKHMFRDSEKVRFIDTEAVLIFKCDVVKNYDVTTEARLNTYLEWFLLSMCPKLYITAGNSDLVGFSTYGYSAGCYGRCPMEFVFN